MAEESEPNFDRPSNNNALSHKNSSQHLDVLRRARASRAQAIMLSPQLQTLSQSEINTLFQDLSHDLSWMEVKEIGLHYQSVMPKPSPVRENIIGMENESYSCPEMLPKARGGPGVEQNSKIYQFLAKPRTFPGVEQPEPWSISNPPEVIPDEEYAHEKETKPKWSQHKVDTRRFRSRWKDQNLTQLKAYQNSDHVFPIVQDGKLTLTPQNHRAVYNPMPTSWDDCDLVIEEGKDWDDWLIEHRISSLTIPNQIVREQFCRWMDQLPEDPGVVNIFHLAFFDGTAMPDGVSSMFLPNLKHLPAPRNMKEELTRLHWHETSQGYVYNWSPTNQKRIRAEEERKEDLRRSAPLRAWLNLPPDSKVVPPNIYLRPAELCDSSRVLKIFNWYAEHSPSSEYTKPWNESDYEKLLGSCRAEKLPFIIAARRPEVRFIKNEIDPVVGYAYVRYHGYKKRADSQMGELQVFVHKENKRQHIGRALVDMVLSCFDATHTKSDDYSIDHNSTVQYGAGYGRGLTALVCPLAYHSEAQRKNSWVKKWLQKDFDFHEKTVLEGARLKFGSKFDLCYVSRQLDAPHMNMANESNLVELSDDESEPLIRLKD